MHIGDFISRVHFSLSMLEIFSNFFCFSKLPFSKNSFRNTARVSNSLDPDKARHSVGQDLGINCLQRLSADNKRCHWQEKSKKVLNSNLSFPVFDCCGVFKCVKFQKLSEPKLN